ncbi:Metallo-dependent phosphatase-like protein [Scenedesmus sp. NREL 46B-D3]|nr:Metallo-dependent phosphatase-like protein [Scenedesmus sp. NREL 46B-D3]
MGEAVVAACSVQALQLPAGCKPSVDFVKQLQQSMLGASWRGAGALSQVVPVKLVTQLLTKVSAILDAEPTLLEVQPSASQQRVTVVGDTHGQYIDLCRLFELYGQPSADRVFIFNGDYVDRGAWGVETLLLLAAWKWALPNNVYLLRGNHEGAYCTKNYGFFAEVLAKYGTAGKSIYKKMLQLFAHLPLAALVEGKVLILHGGLFRAPPAKVKGQSRPKCIQDVDGDALELGTLADLKAAGKGGVDPDPDHSLAQLIASDLVWSDPSPVPGMEHNELRGVGRVFGPDVTERFLSQNGVCLIIRSHEGPDARHKRETSQKMPSVGSGYSVDHETPSGKLVTLFSAPDYPQFAADGEERYHNRAAVLHLTAPDYATPAVDSFEAVLPRPQAAPYYDIAGGMMDSEESTKSMGREAEQRSSDHEQESPVAAAATPNSKQHVAAAGLRKQQQQQQQQGAAFKADACNSHPLHPAGQQQ